MFPGKEISSLMNQKVYVWQVFKCVFSHKDLEQGILFPDHVNFVLSTWGGAMDRVSPVQCASEVSDAGRSFLAMDHRVFMGSQLLNPGIVLRRALNGHLGMKS